MNGNEVIHPKWLSGKACGHSKVEPLQKETRQLLFKIEMRWPLEEKMMQGQAICKKNEQLMSTIELTFGNNAECTS